MNVGFYLTEGGGPTGYVLADYLIASVRRHMPGVQIHHFTDDKSAAAVGVDVVTRRRGGAVMLCRAAHQAEVDGDWLFVDTDVVIERDVHYVFNSQFNIAVTDRIWPHLPPVGGDFTTKMPYCAGVVFSRCRAFWVEVHRRMMAMPVDSQKWYGDQRAIAEELDTGRYQQLTLPGMTYQYPPAAGEVPVGTAITHYKGKDRKAMLLRRIYADWGILTYA